MTTRIQDLRWLARLRWAFIAATLAMASVARGSAPETVAWWPTLALVGGWCLSNAALEVAWRRGARGDAATVGAWLLVDVALFTAALFLTGGTMNPFSTLYLVFVVGAAVALPPAWIGAVAALTVLAFGTLFGLEGERAALLADWLPPCTEHGPHAAHAGHSEGGATLDLHLVGMWLATAMVAPFLGSFVYAQRRALERRDVELRDQRESVARAEKLASMATLAAGAAHELSTPLSTIAVVAAELEEVLEGAPEAREDARLIRDQVRRCHAVLEQLSEDAGAHTGEGLVALTAAEVCDAALREQPDAARVAVDIQPGAGPLALPRRPVVRALRSLIDNALRADPGRPEVRVDPEGDGWHIVVRDRGPGMSADVLGRATEPFFSTRPEGQGMGLGLHLAAEVARQLGGGLRITQPADGGTCVHLHLNGATT